MTDSVPRYNLPPRHIAPQPLRDAVDPFYKSPPNFTHLLPVSICRAHSPVPTVMKNSHYTPPRPPPQPPHPTGIIRRPLGQLPGGRRLTLLSERVKQTRNHGYSRGSQTAGHFHKPSSWGKVYLGTKRTAYVYFTLRKDCIECMGSA